MLPESPVRLCCGKRHDTIACPDGKVMCCICFHRFTLDELAVGVKRDVCKGCDDDEKKAREDRQSREEGQDQGEVRAPGPQGTQG